MKFINWLLAIALTILAFRVIIGLSIAFRGGDVTGIGEGIAAASLPLIFLFPLWLFFFLMKKLFKRPSDNSK